MTQAKEGRRRLAVVDDDEDVRGIIRKAAEPLGWEVSEFTNGRSLVTHLQSAPAPDLILLDLVMPELDGIETIGWIAATLIRCPLVLITGKLPVYSDVARSLGEARGLEIRAILQKPFPLKQLRELLSEPD